MFWDFDLHCIESIGQFGKNWHLCSIESSYSLTWTISPFLQKEMATHSSSLAWEIQWTEEPGGLQSIGSQRVGHNWATEQAATCSTTYEKGKFGHRCALRSPCDNDSRDQDEAATSQGPKITSKPQETRREAWHGVVLIALRRSQLCRQLDLDF